MQNSNFEQQCVNAIRILSMDAVEKANSGHPGMPMGMADVTYVLWTEFLKHNPQNPDWFNRDRFVLSAGHGSMLLYSLLYLTGYDLSLEELKNFRQWNSKTPGHPEYGLTPGVETTTGPLGQGFANGVGMAIAEAHLAGKFNTPEISLIDHFTYAIVSDGDLMEGISQEAASLAGHLKLGRLIYLYDDNHITIDGSTDLAFTEDVPKRFEANGWHCLRIDGHDRPAVRKAIREAQSVTDKPSLICCKTKIGYGSPHKEGSETSHGAPLGEEEIKLTKQNYDWNTEEAFFIPEKVLAHFRQASAHGNRLEEEWNYRLDELQSSNPGKATEFYRHLNDYEIDWDAVLPDFEADPKGMATRKASGETLKNLASAIPNLIGGSADLTGSNSTAINVEVFNAENRKGRYIHYGVREHAMVAIMNGINLHRGLKTFGGTFLIFSDYCRPAIRLAALSEIPTVLVFTHDSIGLGEDGPTHQPVEHLASLRAIPNLYVMRPADANETARCWKIALERKNGPTALALTRQGIPVYDRSAYAGVEGVEKGAYVLAESRKDRPDVILIATGSEVSIALEARELLAREENIDARVVSMPCWELFREQSEEYRETVLPKSVTARISIEAGATQGWQEWTGDRGCTIGFNRFGASAPWKTIYEAFGLTPEKIAGEAIECITRNTIDNEIG